MKIIRWGSKATLEVLLRHRQVRLEAKALVSGDKQLLLLLLGRLGRQARQRLGRLPRLHSAKLLAQLLETRFRQVDLEQRVPYLGSRQGHLLLVKAVRPLEGAVFLAPLPPQPLAKVSRPLEARRLLSDKARQLSAARQALEAPLGRLPHLGHHRLRLHSEEVSFRAQQLRSHSQPPPPPLASISLPSSPAPRDSLLQAPLASAPPLLRSLLVPAAAGLVLADRQAAHLRLEGCSISQPPRALDRRLGLHSPLGRRPCRLALQQGAACLGPQPVLLLLVVAAYLAVSRVLRAAYLGSRSQRQINSRRAFKGHNNLQG